MPEARLARTRAAYASDLPQSGMITPFGFPLPGSGLLQALSQRHESAESLHGSLPWTRSQVIQSANASHE